VDEPEAAGLLKRSGWDVKTSVVMAGGLSYKSEGSAAEK
jgi:hypothetical protein